MLPQKILVISYNNYLSSPLNSHDEQLTIAKSQRQNKDDSGNKKEDMITLCKSSYKWGRKIYRPLPLDLHLPSILDD